MATELTNLLPPDRQAAAKREYLMRVATLGCALLAFLVLAHGAMLVPSYLYLKDRVALAQNRLAELDAALASSGEGELSTRLARIREDVTRLSASYASPSSSAAFRAVLDVPAAGISLSGLTFRMPEPDGRMTLTGTAATRESLRQYASLLSALPFAEGADLPLSAYAKESDIPFTITLTGPLKP